MSSRSERGFTLLEAMISLGLLSIGMLGLVGLQITTINGNRFSGRLQQALLLAEEKVATLSAMAYDDAALVDSNTGNNPSGSGKAFASVAPNVDDPTSVAEGCDKAFDANGQITTDAVGAGSAYQRCWQIADEEWNTNISGKDAKRIRVFVRYRDVSSRLWREASVTTLKSMVMR